MEQANIYWLLIALVITFATLLIGVYIGKRGHFIVNAHMMDNHDVSFEMISQTPRMVLIHNFLKAEECQHLIELAEPRMSRSTVQGKDQEYSNDRTSSTTNLKRAEDPIVREVEQRAALLANHSLSQLEPLQVVRYKPGEFYKPHYDYFVAGKEGTIQALKKGGQRTVTLFVYLNDMSKDEKGGFTAFPHLSLSVVPRKGTALMFHNILPNGEEDARMLHGGQPPTHSIKYGMNIWFRQRIFE